MSAVDAVVRGSVVEAEQFGVYVHVPFCARRCDYCAFATWTDRHHLHASYASACIAEVEAAPLPPATSVFFGGGTPSLLDPSLLGSILSAIRVSPGVEVTVECNPDTVSPALLESYRSFGITRLSFGVQSMVPHVLSSLGRTHDPAAVVACARLASSLGFASWSVDLIYGAAGESMSDWSRTLSSVLSLSPPPPHVSAYALTVEPGTPLAADVARHPDDDDAASKYLGAEVALGAAGLSSYEISNWSLPGHECRHNLLYWSQGAYRGIGCAAHSHVDGRRWWNVRTPDRYISLIGSGRSVEAASETLSTEQRRIEQLQLSLRTRAGVPASSLSPSDIATLSGLVEDVDLGGGEPRLRLTVNGRLLANEVAVRLR